MAIVQADSIRSIEVKSALARSLRLWRSEYQFIWAPVFLIAGIWLYFGLLREPSIALCTVIACAGAASAKFGRGHAIATMLALVCLGFVLSKFRTEWVSTAQLGAVESDISLTGYISDVEARSQKRFVVIVDVETALGLLPGDKPRRVKLSGIGKAVDMRIGDRVKFIAFLTPLARPIQPGSFHYGRQLFLQSIGAVGRVVGDVQILSDDPPLKYLLRRSFHDLRRVIGIRIRQVIEGPIGSFADAIITGERASIPRAMIDSLQRSGLFHILSISGLHMSLVAGGVFWLVRAVLATVPHAALYYPIKKWAAGAALVMGLVYMLLADSGAATERSYVMIAVMFFAILVDRPAVSLHNLSLAAILILVREPEQALAASFQMSFLAVMGIAAMFEWWRQRKPLRYPTSTSSFGFYFRKLSRILAASVMTSFVAGTLSSIPAVFHFGRIAPFSVVANALVLPVVGIVVMPMALLGTVLLPFGLEHVPYTFLAYGLDFLLLISDEVASWSWSGVVLPRPSVVLAVAMALGTVFVGLSPGWWRLVGVPIVLFGLVFGRTSHVDVIVEERAANVAIRDTDGRLVIALPRSTRFAVERWLLENGDQSSLAELQSRPGWKCSPENCDTTIKGKSVLYLLGEAPQVCPQVDILVSAQPLKKRCRGRLATIDRFDVWKAGAIALTILPGGVKQYSSVDALGNRPWVYSPKARRKTWHPGVGTRHRIP